MSKKIDIGKIIVIILFIIIAIFTILDIFSPLGVKTHCLPHDNIRSILIIIKRILYVICLIWLYFIIRSNKKFEITDYLKLFLIVVVFYVVIPLLLTLTDIAISKYDFNKYAEDYCTLYRQIKK